MTTIFDLSVAVFGVPLRERAKETGLPAAKRRAKPRMIEGQTTTNWKQALAQQAAAYPDRINPYL